MRRTTLVAMLPLLCLLAMSAGCGGGTTQSETCTDDVKNQNETDVDCGGVCTPCANGMGCLVDADCASGECQNGLCSLPGETCNIGDTRCNAAGNVETCAHPGDHWEETVCDQGCQVAAGQAECIQGPDCTAGETRCTAGGDLETCDANGAWQQATCQYGCVTEAGASRCADAPDGAMPSHLKQSAGSGVANSNGFRARVRLGAPIPNGSASAAGKRLAGSSPVAP